MRRRILALLLAFSLCFTQLAVTANAGEVSNKNDAKAVITVGSVSASGANNAEITVPVTIQIEDSSVNVTAVGLEFKYDTSVLTLKELNTGDRSTGYTLLSGGEENVSEGVITWAGNAKTAINTDAVTYEPTLVYLKFEAKAGYLKDTYPIRCGLSLPTGASEGSDRSASFSDTSTGSGVPVDVFFEAGAITFTDGIDPNSLHPAVTATSTAVTYTYNQTPAPKLTASVTEPENKGTITCEWYKATGANNFEGATKVEGAADAEYTLPTPTTWSYPGTEYYFCKVTNNYNGNDYTRNSPMFTVTYAKAQLPTPALSPAETFVYDGEEKTVEPQITGLTSGSGNDYIVLTEQSTLSATEVGEYTVTVAPAANGNYTANSQGVSKKWTITQADYTVGGTRETTIYLYEGAQDVEIGTDILSVKTAVKTNPPEIDRSKITYASGDTNKVTIVDGKLHAVALTEGEETVTVTATIAGDKNHKATSAEIKVKVSGKIGVNDKVTFEGKSGPFTYNTTPVALSTYVDGATIETGTLGVGEKAVVYRLDGEVVDNLDVTKVLDAGEHTFTATFEDDTHIGVGTVKITIAKQTITPTVTWKVGDTDTAYAEATGFTYDGTEKSITPSVTPAQVEVASVTGNSATNASNTYSATATLKITDADSKNYALAEGTATATQAWKINKAAALTDLTVKEEVCLVRYNDGTDQPISTADITSASVAKIDGLAIDSVVNASGTIFATGYPKVDAGVVKYAINTSDTFTANQSGTFDINVSSTNYLDSVVSVMVKVVDKFVVSADKITITPPALTYNGAAQGLTKDNVSYTSGAFTGEVDYKFEYSTDNTAWQDDAYTNAGTYYVKVTCETETQRGIKSVQYTIDKKTLTITGATVTPKDYDTTDAATITAVTFSGLVTGESLSMEAPSPDYTVTNAKFADANFGTDKNVTFTVTLEDTAKANNYTLGTATTGSAKGTINKKAVTPVVEWVDATNTNEYPFNNSVQTPALKVTYDSGTVMAASEYTVTYPDGRKDVGTYTVTITPKANSNYTFSSENVTSAFKIVKAAKANITMEKVHKAGQSVTIDLPTLENAGTPAATYTVDGAAAGILTAQATTDGNKLSYTIKDDAAANATGSIVVKVTSGNYADYNITVNITVTTKEIPNATVQNLVKTYDGQALTEASFQKSSDVAGTWAIKTNASSTNASNVPYDVVLTFTPDDAGYVAVDVPAQVTINKARPVVTPSFTKVTEAGKTLSNVTLTCTVVPAEVTGDITWDDAAATEVVANQKYSWTFTPTGASATNYEVVHGEEVIYERANDDDYIIPIPPTGAAAGGSTGTGTGSETTTDPITGVTTTKTTGIDGTVTTIKRYPDGSVETEEIKPDGTQTVTYDDGKGNTTSTTTNPDGSSVTRRDDADGSSSFVTVGADGKTTAIVDLSPDAISNPQGSNGAVTLPMDKVYATRDPQTAPTVEVNTDTNQPVKVEIPVSNANIGTVAVLVKPDGTEEIIKTSMRSGSGVSVTVNDGDVVKIVDNTKSFTDVKSDWSKDGIDFVTSREIFNGTSATAFSPDDFMTRAMLMTVLARYENVDTTGGSVWYEKGVAWAVAQGLSDGTNPNGRITREQLATIIYRYAQLKGVDVSTNGSLYGYTDAYRVSDWARDAMTWAVSVGLITGTSDTTLDPSGSATRAQVATIIMRFVENFGA